MTSKHRILFLSANPGTTSRLYLDEECAAIQRELRMTSLRDDFTFESRWAATVDDLFRHVHEVKPRILHFSGHGGGSSGIVLQDQRGEPHEIPLHALKTAVEAGSPHLQVVLLSSCSSTKQARELVSEVDVVIGMAGNISDDAARSFAVGFYRCLGYGASLQLAFKQAVAVVAAKSPDEHEIPQWMSNTLNITAETQLDPSVDDAPNMEAHGGGAARGSSTHVAMPGRPAAVSGNRRLLWLTVSAALIAVAGSTTWHLIGKGPKTVEMSVALQAEHVIARRSDSVGPGDTLRIASSGNDTLWLYRDDQQVYAQCPGDARCSPSPDGWKLTLTIEVTGRYRVLVQRGAPAFEPTGDLDADLLTLAKLGARSAISDVVMAR